MRFKEPNNKWSHDWCNPYNKHRIKRQVPLTICGYCEYKLKAGEKLSLHHIEFYEDGGLTIPENLCWLHEDCHRRLHLSHNQKKKHLIRRKFLKLKIQNII